MSKRTTRGARSKKKNKDIRANRNGWTKKNGTWERVK